VIAALPSRLAKGIRLSVDGRIAFLHPTIVTTSQQSTIGIKESRTNGNAAFGQADPRLLNRNRQHCRNSTLGVACWSVVVNIDSSLPNHWR
jgi:hypothetical protein